MTIDLKADDSPSVKTGAARQSHPSVLLRWAPFVVVILGVAAAAKAVAEHPISDPDTWWHLRLGEEFLGNWSLTDPGYLTSFGTEEWRATQWLPEVLAAQIAEMFGLPGVVWLTALGTVGLAAALYFACRASAEPLAAGIAAILGLVGAFGSVAPRPQLVSFVLLALVVSAWLRSTRDLRPRWWLIPLSWVWACSHGMWFLGPLVGMAVVAGLVLDRAATPRQLGRLASVPLASLVVAGLTPAGPSVLWLPVTTRGNQQFITEWAPASLTDLPLAVTLGMAAVVVVAWSRRPGAVAWSHVLLLAMAVGWALFAARTVALGAIIVAPLLAGVLQTWLRRPSMDVGIAERVGAGVVGAVIAALAVSWLPTQPTNLEKFPEGLSPALEAVEDDTVVYNDFFLGGWLSWRHPHVDGVIDGMTHAYSADWIADYARTQSLQPGWYEHLTGTAAEVALLEADAPITAALEEHYDWEVVAEDDTAGYVLLEAPGA